MGEASIEASIEAMIAARDMLFSLARSRTEDGNELHREAQKLERQARSLDDRIKAVRLVEAQGDE